MRASLIGPIARRLETAVGLAMLAALASLAAVPPAWPQSSKRTVKALSAASLIYIATVRKDGNQSRATPVWFTTTANHNVLIETPPGTWKARRIRRGSPVLIWIGSPTGPAFIGRAQIIKETAAQNKIIRDYPQKYFLARIGYARPTRKKFDDGKIVAIRITPVEDLPDGFTSRPGSPAPALNRAAPKATESR